MRSVLCILFAISVSRDTLGILVHLGMLWKMSEDFRFLLGIVRIIFGRVRRVRKILGALDRPRGLENREELRDSQIFQTPLNQEPKWQN